MFPALNVQAQDLFEMGERDRVQLMNVHAKYATEFILSGNYAVDELGIAVISEFVHERTYVRLTKRHIQIVLRSFPYACMMLGKYGVQNEDARVYFIDCLSILLTGVSFADVSEFKNLMCAQHGKIFESIDRSMERHGIR